MKTEKILLSASIISAIIFVALLPGVHPYPLSFVLKIVPLTSLSVLVFRKFSGTKRVLLLLALLFCMAGDILLDLDRSGNFKAALAVFLTGHVFYIIVFQRERKIQKKLFPWLIAIILYTLTTGFILRGIDRAFLIPVMAYLVVISIMTLSAFMMKKHSWFLALGALIFMFSDTIIAVNKFLYSIPNSTVFNIGLYFTAQILIIYGLMKRERKEL